MLSSPLIRTAWPVGLIVGLIATAQAGHEFLPAQVGPHRYEYVPAQGTQPPTFRTEANYVRVDVYPTVDGVPVADLQREDFEVAEDGAVQTIDAFDHIVIRGVSQDQRGPEPSSVAESRAMLENPRARVFVLFLDAYHVSVEGSANIRAPLTRALDRLIGPEDLFGVMTPEMSALDVAFARKTTTIAGILDRYWTWGERFQLVQPDPEDNRYLQCYPGFEAAQGCLSDKGVAEEMISRRHEKRSIDALRDLVRYLRGVREERKAILVFSEGWRLFRPNETLARMIDCQAPQSSPIGIDPRGRLTAKPEVVDSRSANRSACDRDRRNLAQLDNDQEFRGLLDEANRSNASFYPVDPRGLVVFDEPISVPNAPAGGSPSRIGAPPSVDRAQLTARLDALRAMAAATDGIAVTGSNDLDSGLRRIVDDLSSYYLLGYYSTGKFDGRFHSIRVRVKRPGVQVRARRGYRAPTVAEVTASSNRPSPAAPPANAAAAAEAVALESVLARLSSYGRELPLRLHAAAGWTSSNAPAVIVVGEVAPNEAWKGGGDVDVMLVGPTGDTVATERATISPGTRGFMTTLTPGQALAAGQYTARVRVRSRSASAAPVNDVVQLTVGSAPATSGAIFVRRSAASGNRDLPTADLRFRRTEQIRIELPAEGAQPAVRLLDRAGKPIPLPITLGVREDPSSVRWHTAQLSLAPLAAGDYVIEVSAAGGVENGRRMLAFRVVQ
jgi:VWFA-related protein